MTFVLRSLIVFALGFTVLPQAALASSVGFPVWTVTNAFFDTFPAKTFVGDAPDAANTTLFSVTANNTFPSTGGAGAVTGGGDRLYNGWAASSVAFNIQLNGSVTGTLDRLELLVKLTPPDVATGLTRATFFTADLLTSDGNPADPAAVEIVSNTGESIGAPPNNLPFGVIQFVWTGLNLSASDTFTINLTSPASGHVSVDAIAVAVPEPNTLALVGLALAGVGAVSRRRTAVSLH